MSKLNSIEPGTRFGRWVVVRPEKDSSVRRYVCICECGSVGVVRKDKLLNETSRSCGCLQRENLITHGMTASGVKRWSREYWIWNSMIQRCTNPKSNSYANYGGRGISVCDRWRKFETFYSDMGPRPSPKHSIDRIDNNKGYEPGNCRWATRQEQNQNRCITRVISAGGTTRCLSEWARHLGCSHSTILARIKLGWTEEEAVLTQVRKFSQ